MLGFLPRRRTSLFESGDTCPDIDLSTSGEEEGSSCADDDDDDADDTCSLESAVSTAYTSSVARESERCCFSSWHALAAICLLLGQVAFLITVAVEPPLSDTCQPDFRKPSIFVYIFGSAVVLAFAVVFVHVSRDAHDPVTVRASRYAFLAASMLLALGLCVALEIVSSECQNEGRVAIVLADALALVMFPILAFNFFGLVEERVRLTEAGFGMRLGARSIRAWRFGFLVTETLEPLVYWGLLLCSKRPELQFLAWWIRLQVHNALSAVTYLTVGLIAFRGFSFVLNALSCKDPKWTCVSYACREQRWAEKVFQRLRWLTLFQCMASSALHVALVAMYFSDKTIMLTNIVYAVVQPILFLTEIAFLLTITGLFKPARSLQSRPARPQSERQLLPGDALPRTGIWERTVKELASRGISVEELLDFYELLGKPDGPMPHYMPQASTTNDVVRQVIIPLSQTSAGGGVAYAAKLSCGGKCLPQVMVTHTWTGLFLDLIAAVAADARGRDEYDSIALDLAKGDLTGLRAALRRRGTLGRIYWVCAFSVNQHSGICGALGRPPPEDSPRYSRWDRSRRDSITDVIFPLCNCSQPKYFNDTHPEECEMNKFDDMMELLSTEVEDFSQLVVVDRDYSVFDRAWCVAELHRAYAMGLSQKVCLQENRVLDVDTGDLGVYKKLATLTVISCQASRPQDKEEILRRIPDTQEFDEQLQEVIFGNRGLLARQLEGFGVLEAAARTAYRVLRSQSSKLESVLAQ